MEGTFDQIVSTRYLLYNSLFLNLPYAEIYRTGTLLPLLQQGCENGFAAGKDPRHIIRKFFRDFAPDLKPKDQFNLLFKFIQYTERQVVLFDSVEDAAFEHLHDANGRGTVNGFLLRISTDEMRKQLRDKLDNFSVRVVLTAHPTQFYPGNVLAIINDLENAIRENHLDHINLLLRQLSKTAFINREKPTPFDEAVSLCWFLETVFYQVIPDILTKLMEGLKVNLTEWTNFSLFKIGFWPGGDRDGNPFVTHDITIRVAEQLKTSLMKCYYKDLRILRRRLTFRKVDQMIQEAENKIYQLAYGRGTGDIYHNAEELLADLMTVRKLLIEENGGLFLNLLDNFILKVKVFGFYLATMDIRQDSRKHAYAWDAILAQLQKSKKSLKNLAEQPEEEQINQLLNLKFDVNKLKFEDPFITELMESIKVIQTIQDTNGVESCHRYVISNCRSALDVIRVFQLARVILSRSPVLHLDIVPLFETIEDLADAAGIMESLYRIPVYREHLRSRGDKQTIMLGFSDGTKDGGYLRANWSIFRAKEELTRVTREHGLKAVFFDGRGGPPARGGGNTHDFYASLGDTIEDNEVQVTIQGQTISSNFGTMASCAYNLEQLLSAGIENDIFHSEGNQLDAYQKELLESLAEEGHKAYLSLKNDPSFVPYLEKATPLRYFSDINIGSRPVKRNQSERLNFSDLRAIPFVGSWAQMKQNIPGFYGVGTALQALKKQGLLKDLKKLYKRSLFFRTLLGNTMMSLTKSFYPATSYLSRDEEFSRLWKIMFKEFELSSKLVLEVGGLNELMQTNPINRDSVKLRERIVLPLIAIQQFAMQQLRDEGTREYQAEYQKLILRCMFGIVNAARNSA